MNSIISIFKKDGIGNPPWDYYFLKNLDEKEYPRYLAKLFYLNTGEKLPLKYDFKNSSSRVDFSPRRQGFGSWIIDKKRCKTFNQKIQWLKLYGVTDLMRKCTDKVAVRDYVAEKIGSEYLKPVLQVIPDAKETDCGHICPPCGESTCYSRGKGVIKDTSALNSCLPQYDETITDINTLSHSEPNVNSGVKNLYNSSRVDFSQSKQDVTTYFDQIDWEKLPNSFVIKCNHGCKWQYIIKDKGKFLQNKQLFDIVKRNITGWLEQDYSFWGGFEMQYKTVKLNHNVIASKSTSFQDLRGNPACLKEQNKSQPNHHGTLNVNVPSDDKYIEPKILIEPLLSDKNNKKCEEIQVYCFNGDAKLIYRFNDDNNVSVYDKNFNNIEDILEGDEIYLNKEFDGKIKQSIDLSRILSKNFKFVRVDWMLNNSNLYFGEMTFTPYSGFVKFRKPKYNLYFGQLIRL